MLFDKFNVFLHAINNEISIDQDLLVRLERKELGFTPVRALGSLKYIDKYSISSLVYGVIAIFFYLISPFMFFGKMLSHIFSKKYKSNKLNLNNQSTLVLVANSHAESLVKRIDKNKDIFYLNINQLKSNHVHIYSYLNFKDYLKAFFLSVASIQLLLLKLPDKRDILQGYVAYEWFLVHIGLSNQAIKADTVYFSNHYDRWAVMFDNLFRQKKLILLQHGLTTENIQLGYPLSHINTIYRFNTKSEIMFRKIFLCEKTNFKKLPRQLNITAIDNSENSILIIGHPHTISFEKELILEIQNSTLDLVVLIKPHPLYDMSAYKKIKDITLITDKKFFPKVQVVICWESTLGYEYEEMGFNVIWWKNMSTPKVAKHISQILNKKIKPK